MAWVWTSPLADGLGQTLRCIFEIHSAASSHTKTKETNGALQSRAQEKL